MNMNVLVMCEYSGVVRNAFRRKGHMAWSCDLLPSDDGSKFHHEHDCLEVMRTKHVRISHWDLIIMHPPCTALAVSGNRWYGKGMAKHHERIASIEWTMNLFNEAKKYAPYVCMENPVGVLPVKPTQYIQPWEFGHGETKKTGLWLHNLPKLTPTDVVEGREQRVWKMGPSPDRWKLRSKTYQGIADAMAEQWDIDNLVILLKD